MRCRMAAVVVLLVLPLTGAQQEGPMLDDPQGDVEVRAAGAPQVVPDDRFAAVDLRSLTWGQGPDGFHFQLTVAELDPPTGASLGDSVSYHVGFDFEGVAYAVLIDQYYTLTGEPRFDAGVAQVHDEGGYRYYDWTDVVALEVDLEADTLSGAFARDALMDQDGAPAGLGDVLRDFYVEAAGNRLFYFSGPAGEGAFLEAWDRMPDDGTLGLVEVSHGVAQGGDGRLDSPAPFRLSNGGATSIVFQVDASNLGERQSFRLALENLPDGWNVQVPFDRIVLDAEESRSFPVLLTTPSGHRHGGSERFLLTMTGERDKEDVGRIELGVKYTTIPQPAGHHPRLHMHSYAPYGSQLGDVDEVVPGFFDYIQGYLNAAPPEDDPMDTQQPIRSYNPIIPGPQWFYWHMPLLPGLGIGLDFDTKKSATLSFPLEYEYVAQDVEVTAVLRYEGPRGDIALASSVPAAPVSFGPQASHTFEIEMEVAKEAEFLAFDPDARLGLEIEMRGMFLGPTVGPGSVPAIATGGWLDLPLIEYHDPVDSFYRAVQSLAFEREYLEKPVNPGEAVLFQTSLRNAGKTTEKVSLNLTGLHHEWARILGADSFELGPGKQRDVAVAVVVPEGVPHGALADLVLQAVSQDDPLRRGMIGLIAFVDEDNDHPDQSSELAKLDKRLDGKKSPAFEVVALAMGLLAMLLVLRRRR